MTTEQNTRLGAQERRTQLLESARETFGVKGFTATSMNDIAEAAGVTKPVLYQHFESKHDLFHQLLTETADELASRLSGAVLAATSGRQKVEDAVHTYVAFFDENPHRFRVLFGEGVRSDPVFSEELRALDSSFHSFTAAHIDIEDLDSEHRLVLGQAISGQLEAAVDHWIRGGRPMSANDLAALLARFAWRGLRGGSGTQ